MSVDKGAVESHAGQRAGRLPFVTAQSEPREHRCSTFEAFEVRKSGPAAPFLISMRMKYGPPRDLRQVPQSREGAWERGRPSRDLAIGPSPQCCLASVDGNGPLADAIEGLNWPDALLLGTGARNSGLPPTAPNTCVRRIFIP